METIKKSNGKSSSRLSKCIMFIDKFILEVILLKSKVNIALKLKKKKTMKRIKVRLEIISC